MSNRLVLGKTAWHRQTQLKGMVIQVFSAGGVRVHTSQGQKTWRRREFKLGLGKSKEQI
jgi:hypothetical protein